ncbi:hypothetical protein ABZS71_29125 [Streptomyces sp. NPDC005393]|uniref:hypothetical protein n=1 Tax=Streptomyces sp. NPDC005393 TaxID=3157041 RepID=UPI0033BB1FFC
MKMVNQFQEQALSTRLKIPIIYGILAAAEHTRASLLLTASDDLRAPLRTAEEALVRLRDLHATGPADETTGDGTHLLDTARSSVRRASSSSPTWTT